MLWLELRLNRIVGLMVLLFSVGIKDWYYEGWQGRASVWK